MDKIFKIQNNVTVGKIVCVSVVVCSLYAPCNKNMWYV